MIVEFAQAGALLLALCSIQSLVVYRWRNGALAGRAVSGVVFGAICIVGMMTPIVLMPGIIFDPRTVVLAMSGLFGGPVTAGIATLFAGAYRLWLGGTGTVVGLATIACAALFGLAYREAHRRGWLRIRVAELLAFGFVLHLAVLGLFAFLPAEVATAVMDRLALPMLLAFTPATALLGYLLKMIEDHIEARAALEKANRRFRQIADNIREVFWMVDPAKREVVYVNPAFERIWGRSCESLYRDPGAFFDSVHPDDRERVGAAIADVGHEPFTHIFRIVRPDGSVRTIRDQVFAVPDEDGEPGRRAGVAEDITEQEEREAQLRQARKMEALGQLTGGVAHDFNNLLLIIQGNAELLEDKLGAEDNATQAIMRASRRGGELTQRLLSFARRQPLRSAPADVGALIDRVAGLLDRTLGRDIDLRVELADGLSPAMLDAGQMENALVNLAINARDAMSGDGELTIRAANEDIDDGHPLRSHVPATGGYVRVAVSDTGCGMSDHVRAHAFEPFFTTNDVGEGSGLGLSMVYGFAKQSGGHITVDSEEGAGTTISLYLPQAPDREAAPSAAAADATARGAGQTVLVVEDDADVRAYARTVVEALGYRALGAGTADEALDLLRNGETVDALLCDVVLAGGTNGPALVARVRETTPDMRAVFMSGYPKSAVPGSGEWPSDDVLVTKPFSKGELASALEEAFRGRPGEPPAPPDPGHAA